MAKLLGGTRIYGTANVDSILYVNNSIFIGNTTSNATVNTTVMTVNAFSVGSVNTATFYSINGQVNASAGAFVGNAYATLGGASGNYLAFGQQLNSAQWMQSGYSSAGSPVYYHIIMNPLGGNIGIGNTAPADRLSVNGTTYHQGNVILGSATIAVGVQANGGYGTAGQVLTSNGTATYWAAGSGGGFTNGQSIMVSNAAYANSSNVAATYTFYNSTTKTLDTVFI